MDIVASSTGRYLGVFASPNEVSGQNSVEENSGVTPSIVHMVVDWTVSGSDGTPQLVSFDEEHPDVGGTVLATAQELATNGQVLAISWDPTGIEATDSGYYDGTQQPVIGLQEILDGGFDDYIRQVAQQIASMDVPVMMNLFGESDSVGLLSYGADGNGYRGAQDGDETNQYGDPLLLDGPERVRDVFRHVIDLFRAEGADNATWFMYMGSDLMTEADSVHPSEFYPGDEYIDWVGQSLYVDNPSQIPASLQPGYDAWGAVTSNPFFIPEMGLTELGEANDFADVFTQLDAFERVNAVALTNFELAESVYGVTPLGVRSGDWSSIQAATSYHELVQIQIDESGGSLPLDEWRNAMGLDTFDYYIRGTESADLMIGSGAQDVFEGLAGDDIYVIQQQGNQVIESAGGGYDLVLSHVDYTLETHLEELILEGTSNISGTGNNTTNQLSGNAGDNQLTGLGGDDILNGGEGADTLIGGAGDDMYFVENAGDVLIEQAGEGFDVVIALVSTTLSDNIEFLAFEGSGNLNGTGNALDNVIFGTSGDNNLRGEEGDDQLVGLDGQDILRGGAGNDLLEGGAGNDTLTGGAGVDVMVGGDGDDVLFLSSGDDLVWGGAGADAFVFSATGAFAIIQDFESEVDSLDLTAFNFASEQSMRNAVIDVDGGALLSAGTDSLLFFENSTANAILASDILF